MKKSQKICILLFFLPTFIYGQYHNELGFFNGMSYYLGDLNPSKQFAMSRFVYGGMYRFSIDEHKSLRINGYYGSVEADDAVIGYNENRNLHFRSIIGEISIQGEINFLPFNPGDSYTIHTPYIFGGIGGFKFNPQAKCNDGLWHDLQPLKTEGQNEPYDLYAASYIFGIGYKFHISKYFTGSLEWGMRRTSTDYLDDVSNSYANPDNFDSELAYQLSDRSLENRGQNTNKMRGNPYRKDWYSFAGFILTFKLPSWGEWECYPWYD